jgi:HEAT repeat protein
MGNAAESVRKEAFETLKIGVLSGKRNCVGEENALATLLNFGTTYSQADIETRENAIAILALTKSATATDYLISAMGNHAASARKKAFEALSVGILSGQHSCIGKENALASLLTFGTTYSDADIETRKDAISILALTKTEIATDYLIQAMGNSAESARTLAFEKLNNGLRNGELNFVGRENALAKLLSFGSSYSKSDLAVRQSAIGFLKSAKTKAALTVLQDRLSQENTATIKAEIKEAIADLNKSGIY